MKFLKLLKKLKNLSTHPVHQMGCVIAKKNQVISIGFNKYKTSPRSKHPYGYIHAELSAVLDNKFTDLNGATAYIYRETKDGIPAISKPCPSCMHTLKLAGIKKICYSNNGSFKEEKL
jgi:deoxycytidylate deaminase